MNLKPKHNKLYYKRIRIKHESFTDTCNLEYAQVFSRKIMKSRSNVGKNKAL